MHHTRAISAHPGIKTLLFVVLVCQGVNPLRATPTESEIRNLAARADALMRLGVSEKGATLAFEDASALIDRAEEQLLEADLPAATESELAREIEAAREDIEDLVELYNERFFGVFPLARLTLPSLLADEGLLITEQLFHPPDVAVVIVATRKVADLLDEYHHPYVVFRSSPPHRHLENVASEELLRDGRSTPQTRRMLINALGKEEWRRSIGESSRRPSSVAWRKLWTPSAYWCSRSASPWSSRMPTFA